MAVLKFLVSAALLGTVARSQNSPAYSQNSPAYPQNSPAYPQNSPAYYQAYSPGGSLVQYSPSIFNRGTSRLVPIKVRAAPSRIIPSFYYPQVPPPNLGPNNYQRQTRQLLPAYATSSMLHQPNFLPRPQQYRSAMTGYYRPARQSYFSNPFFKQHELPNANGQHQQYHTAATSAPAVVKRGRVLSASPYNLQSAAATSAPLGGGFQYAPQYRPAPQYQTQQPQQQQYRPQIAAAPIQQLRPQPQYASPYQHPQQIYQQQPTFYIQKSPHVVGPDRPRKLIKVKKIHLAQQQQPLRQVQAAEPEEEQEQEQYPSDPNPQYNFSFDIKDDELTNYQNRQEERDGQTIKGSYSVVDPDGYVRTVTYTADPKNGFQAKVTREPTDVKIKFPVPTEAPRHQPAQPANQKFVTSGRGQTYINPQQYQPQYQTAAYANNREVYANAPSASATSTVSMLSAPIPSLSSTPFTSRSSRRVYAIQPDASESAPKPRVVSISRGKKSESKKTEQQDSETDPEK